jgi:predicted metal-dependent hydrolase
VNSPQDKIDYKIKRSKRSTADIIIDRDGSILVRAPESIPDERIEDLVESKRYWIFKTLAEWRDLNTARVIREFKGGAGFLYLGRTYRLLLVASQDVPLKLKDGSFCLRRELVEDGDVARAQATFRDYYIERGEQKIAERVDYFSAKVGVQPRQISVKELGNRWASCSPSGNLAFHWKCMMAPLSIVDYIVVHELCHMREKDHSSAFWNEIDKVMPGFGERKNWLRDNGAGLDL